MEAARAGNFIRDGVLRAVGKAADCQSATQQITNLYTLLTDVSSLTRRLRVAGKVY